MGTYRKGVEPGSTYCDKLAMELSEKLIELKAYSDMMESTIDYLRPDVKEIMDKLSKSEWIDSFGKGGIYCINASRKIVGDVVIPTEKTGAKKRQVVSAGCEIDEVHHYHDFGVTHLHFKCRNPEWDILLALITQ
jgi:hypothetical protein